VDTALHAGQGLESRSVIERGIHYFEFSKLGRRENKWAKPKGTIQNNFNLQRAQDFF